MDINNNINININIKINIGIKINIDTDVNMNVNINIDINQLVLMYFQTSFPLLHPCQRLLLELETAFTQMLNCKIHPHF